MKTLRGFSIIELMVTLAIVATLAAVALPGYQTYILTQRVRGASYDLMASLVFARSEAIKRNASVSVTQASGGWSQGWTVTSGATVLRRQDSYKGGIAISNSASLTGITYSNDGRLGSATTDFTLASTSGVSQVLTRCVSIRLGGMPSSKIGAC